MSPFSTELARLISLIPSGRVASYGQLAALAGNPRAARQVVRFLNSSTEKRGLPWHRIVTKDGRIALRVGAGFELQQALLVSEGIPVNDDGLIDDDDGPAMERYRWQAYPTTPL